MDIISTWIYLDSPEESSEYPQVGKGSHLPEFQKVYWRCVAVFFEMSVQHNPQRRHILFSNVGAGELPEVDGLNLKSFLKERNVEVVTLPLTWQAPTGWHGKWRNQFYVFDILACISEYSPGDSKSPGEYSEPAFLVLDSDCIVNRPLDGLFAEIREHGLMALPMRFADDYDINGVTRADMRRIFAELDGGKDPGQNPEYCGGEIFAATLTKIREINQIAPRVWEEMNRRFQEGQPKLNEEAHFLSYCYHRIGGWASLEKYIKRIWTSPKYTNAKPEDFELPIWHLPAEKTGGIALLFKTLDKRRWTLEELGGILGVTKRTRYLNLKHFLKHTRLYRWLRSG
ncbi:MAG: hypothetical protein ACKVUS_17615 [Saprospiraceae bacterium]